MSLAVWIVLAVILAALVLWVWELWPVDLVAVCIPVVLVLTGVLEPSEAVAGFSSTALITVGAIFVVSAGLLRTGAVTFVGNRIIHYSRGDERRLLVLVMLTMATFSAFINNTAIVAMFLPIMLGLSREFDLAPSKLLIPMSFASILGGTCTLIGTSTNLLVHGLMLDAGLRGIGMFEISRLGLVLAAAGLAYMFLLGHRLLPDRGSVTAYLQGAQRGASEYMTEIQVLANSPLVGQTVQEVFSETHAEVRLLQVLRGEQVLWPPLEQVVIGPGDVFLLKGDVNELVDLYNKEGVELLPALRVEAARFAVKDMALGEVVITPNSSLVGRTLTEVQFRQHYGVSVMALQRHNVHLREQLINIRLRVGDVMLVMGDAEEIRRLATSDEFIALEGVQEVFVRKDKAPIALALVVGLVTLASFGLGSVMVLALAAAALMVITRCISMREAYDSINLSVLVLIGGAIALGKAMEVTGTASMLAGWVVGQLGVLGPVAVLSGIYLLTVVCTELMSNSAAAVLMLPLALSAAAALGVDPRPFAIAVAFAGSAAFSTPIGYQTNTLVYGPGGYRFLDFTRVGLPLNILLWILASFLIPLLWPLQPVG
ncbi:MAG: SLC13 family permease [Acidobacteriota bacterium]